MAITYVNDLRLSEMDTGDNSGTWGTVTNTNLELIGEALGYGTEAITTNADTHASVIADGSTDPVRAMYVKYTGTLDSDCTITISPNTVNKFYYIENGTSGSQNIIIKQGSDDAADKVTIPAGDTKAVYLDGAGSGAVVRDAFASLNVVDLKVQDDLTVTDDVSIGGLATVGGTLGVTGVLTTTAATVFNGGFAANAGSTISTADNTAQLTLISTDADNSSGPKLTMFRNSGSPADGDALGIIDFTGEDSNGDETRYVAMFARPTDVTNGDEFGKFQIIVATDGVDKDYFHIDAGTKSSGSLVNGEIVFNEDSQDIDFRVESNGNANMLFVNGAEDGVVIGDTDTNGQIFRVKGAGDLVEFVSTNAGSGGTQIILKHESASPENADLVGIINFTGLDAGNNNTQYAQIVGTATDVSNERGNLSFGTRSSSSSFTTKMDINHDGKVGIGVTGNDIDAQLHVAGDAEFNSGTTAGGAIVASTFATSTSLNVSRAQGSKGSPAAMANGQVIGSLNFNGYTSAGAYRIGGQITAACDAGVSGDELPTNLKFGTTANGANSPTTRMTIENNGDVTLEDGNLIVGTAGHGINFAGITTLSGGTSQILDYYEEGTVGITITASGGGTITLDSGSDTAFYTRVGRLVTVGGRLEVDSVSSPSGHVYIRGLPYTADFGTEAAGQNTASGIVFNPSSDLDGQLAIEMSNTYTTSLLVREGGGQAAGVTVMADKIDGDSLIAFTVTYVAA